VEVTSLRQLQYFLAVATTGSFTAAGEQLNVSQPAVGLQVKQLEDRLGVALLNRHSRGVTLTSAGEAYRDYVEKALTILMDAEQMLRTYQHSEPIKVRMGVPPTVERMLLPQLLQEFVRSGVNFSVSLSAGLSDRHLDSLMAGDLDCAFCYDVESSVQVSATPLFQEDIYLVGLPSIIGAHDQPIDFEQLQKMPLVLSPKSNPLRLRIEKMAAQIGIRLNPAMEFTLPGLKREVLLRSGYCALSPYGLFLPDIKDGTLVARKLVNPTVTRTMNFVINRKIPALTAHRLNSIVRGLFGEVFDHPDLRWRKLS
jgi:LysR family nitrogen assimilation transcriptional regulator